MGMIIYFYDDDDDDDIYRFFELCSPAPHTDANGVPRRQPNLGSTLFGCLALPDKTST